MNDHRKENVVVVTSSSSSSSSALRQSPGTAPTQTASPAANNAKRHSGLFSFLKWFRSSSRESVDCDNNNSLSSSIDGAGSLAGSSESLNSTGTAASFSFVPPAAYAHQTHSVDKCINPGPETDTYRARLKQRDRTREKDKNITLRKKYNLFFNRDKDTTSGKHKKERSKEDNCKSLPLMMTKKTEQGDGEKGHRRTNSDSSKNRKAGAYLHVKGKRKAPAPPPKSKEDSLSLRRKKRLAPQPPAGGSCASDKIITLLNSSAGGNEDSIEYADVDNPAPVLLLQNDSLRLDHGMLKPTKATSSSSSSSSPQAALRHSGMNATSAKSDIPVSPKPWYKRATSKRESKYEPVIPPPCDNNNDRRKSNMMFLTNISELDREACEIVKKNRPELKNQDEMPEFMKPKLVPNESNDAVAGEVPLQQPSKRKSAKDLIAKFNAITNVTKVTVNSAFFGGGSPSASAKEKRDYFGRDLKDKKDFKDNMMNNHKENAARVNGFGAHPLMKCETSACIIKTNPVKPNTPKLDRMDRKNWACPKCNLENDYWRIICHVCSTIKPYFDDLGGLDLPLISANDRKPSKEDPENATSSGSIKKVLKTSQVLPELPILARSKTQIHFSHHHQLNHQKSPFLEKQTDETKREEKEKLKKMLIEMKNSLPKRKSQLHQLQNRKSTIDEGPENPAVVAANGRDPNLDTPKDEKQQEIAQKIVQKEEEIKSTQEKPDKPFKVSSSVQTSAAVTPVKSPSIPKEGNYQLLRPKDFEDIYTEKVGGLGGPHVYANLGPTSELFFNVPKKLNDLKQNLNSGNSAASNATDTLEINKLLRRLETAIAKGDLADAAGYARELAQLKVNCSVIRQRPECGNTTPSNAFMVDMYVEDRLSHRGPFPIEVVQTESVFQLKQQVQKEFDIPMEVQRWILGKELATDDKATLQDYNVNAKGCPIFLYLVAPSNKQQQEVKELNTAVTVLPRSSNSAFALVKEEKILNTGASPKIVGEQLKVHVMVKPNPNPELVTAIKTSVVVQQAPPAAPAAAPKAIQEDFTEYDKTLMRPINLNWICHMCTLVNIPTTNVCSVCATVRPTEKAGTSNQLHYYELMNLDNSDLVPNAETFECLVCLTDVPANQGVTLRECLHQFCKACLSHTIEYCEEAEVKCPFRDAQYSCDIALQGREIKALVTKHTYDQFLAKSVAQAENKMDKSFHCKTPDCTGWCIYEDNVNDFRCPICKRTNCLTCQAIHLGLNCRQYQERMNAQSETDDDAKRTREMLNEMVEKGEALTCPACHVILMKKWGCDWVRCSMCKTEICWVTRGLRWGPGGKNDTSGGCKCGLNGVKCHPKCNYCH